MAELNTEPVAPESAEWLEQYGRAAEISPEPFREAMDLQLALLEANVALDSVEDASDEAYADYMELAMQMRSPSYQSANEDLSAFLVEVCGIELAEQDPGTPATFTSVGPGVDPEE